MLIYTYRADWLDDYLDFNNGNSIEEDLDFLRKKLRERVYNEIGSNAFDGIIDAVIVNPKGGSNSSTTTRNISGDGRDGFEATLELTMNSDLTGSCNLDIQGKGAFIFIFDIRE